MTSGQSKGKGTEEGGKQLGISTCHQLPVSLLTAGRLPPNQFSEEAVFKAPVLGEMGCETASVVIRTQRNPVCGAFLPSLPLLHLGNSRDSFLSTPLVADWEGQGEDRQHLDPV